jgi:multidrug resistance efflux pump
MIRRLTAAVVFLGGLAGTAAAQPKVIELNKLPDVQLRTRLKEDVELAEAQRDTKQEQLKAAEVQFDVAKKRLADAERTGAQGKDLSAARGAFEVAEVQLGRSRAELREAELRVTQAKRRMNDGVVMVRTPARGVILLPPPAPLQKDDPQLAVLTAAVEARKANVEQVKARVTLAQAQVGRLRELVRKGVVPKAELDAADTKLQITEADLRIALAELAEAEATVRAATRIPVVVPPPLSKAPSRGGLPANVGFPNPEANFLLAQVEYEVAQLRLDAALLEVDQLEKLGAEQADLDAARKRLAAARVEVRAAEDKVLAAQKKLNLFPPRP